MDLLNIFRQNIGLDTYKQMLREVFKADVLLDNSHIEELPAITDDDKGYYIGNKRTSDRYNIGFFYYEIGRSNVARKKVGLRNLVHKFINSRDGQFDAALVAFKDANHWRLSFICDIQDEATAPKRFTFVFGDADSLYRTPIERFGKLQQKGLNKKNIQDAFSVEALNGQFFKDYKAHYQAFVEFITGKRFVEEGGKWVEKVKHDPHPTIYPQFKCDDKSVRDYVKQMMGRIVFLHFLQKKGWMGVPADAETWEGGDQNFMFKLFQYATPAQKNDFLDTVLEPLFFECLNTERERDIYVTPIEAIGKVRIPYLNGELFEKTELDKTECKFDVKLFEDLFNLFNSYNFTIDENDPSDAEIGVDPEMLGKIFENLLEDNKDKGAFYTPKEIVSYMCKESLIAYLQSKFGKAHHDSIRTLVNTHLKDQHLEEDQNVCERLNKALRDIKICDPAIGSGAFPMGLLNEIFACRCQLETTDKPKSELKGEIIQNNIYGVDIERGAVDIARLRFWLALIVDAEKPVPLPNLDYKIMQGNSLLESYKGQDLTKFMENAFAQPYAIQLNKDLKKYFKETNNTEKLKLRKNIDYTIKQCIFQCGIQDEIELPNTEFFLWHTYFKDVFDGGGFDIVIGNPPWGADLSKEDKKQLKVLYPEIDSSTPNSYAYFIGLAKRMCTTSVSLVLPDSILIKDFRKTRELILPYLNEIIWYENTGIPNELRQFKDVEHDVCIISMTFDETDEIRRVCNIYSSLNSSLEIVEYTDKKHDIFLKEFEYVFNMKASPCDLKILDKLKQFGLMSSCMQCHEGIHTGNIREKLFINHYEPGLKRLYYGGRAGDIIRQYYGRTSGWYVNYDENIIDRECGEYASLRDENIFKLPKIYITRTGNPFKAFFDIDNYASNNFFSLQFNVLEDNNEDNLLVVLALLNSRVANYYIRTFAAPRLGNTFIETKIIHLLKLRIPNSLELSERADIKDLVKQIIIKKEENFDADTRHEENRIDFLVCHLYGLTYDEVKIIYGDEEPPFSREEYEAYDMLESKANERDTDLSGKNYGNRAPLKVIVDYLPPYSSFDGAYYNARLHMEYDSSTGKFTYSGWNLSQREIAKYKAFITDVRVLNDFFDDRIAYSKEGGWTSSSPWTLSIEWNGRKKSISVGPFERIPFKHPFTRN